MTNLKLPEIHQGLENIVVAETAISDVQGANGVLVIRGFRIEELTELSPFASTAVLLWQGRLPSLAEEQALARELGEARRRVSPKIRKLLASLPLPVNPLEFQRAALSVLDSSAATPLATQKTEATATMAVAAAYWYRTREGLAITEPDETLPHAADFLRLLNGKAPESEAVQGLDQYLTTVSDHGMNASTFAARVVASTGSDVISAVAAGLGALKGPLHGGAPGPVLDMLDAIGKPANALAWIERQLSLGQRLMGMGHRIYKVRDPRAAVLERALERLERAGIASNRLGLARAVEKIAESALKKQYPARELHANVEFYTAVLLDTLAIPRELFTATFAMGRVLGWCAHFSEQVATGRLIRPESRYIGKTPTEAASPAPA